MAKGSLMFPDEVTDVQTLREDGLTATANCGETARSRGTVYKVIKAKPSVPQATSATPANSASSAA
ncbi:hypothetical protein PC128_g12159 [Phytophthora cactorum]|nr:hypothetical protein PC120_g9218 [Phytophthora cactorum]KAG3188515.1 hypothetical protein PC128_g12159 [Phytophthora cactorum]KAG4055650.1 hypothetical protein PC123_g9262 [Phytophthora cactorum]